MYMYIFKLKFEFYLFLFLSPCIVLLYCFVFFCLACIHFSVVLVWLHIIRFSFSKKAIKGQKFSFSFSQSTKMKKGLLKHI